MSVDEEKNVGGTVEDRKTRQGLRQLDAEVAERVMGFRWRVFPNGRSLVPHKTAPLATGDEPIHPNSGSQVPRYSELISDAMEVVDSFQEQDVELAYMHSERRWRVTIKPRESVRPCGQCKPPQPSVFYSCSLAEAICRAALKATECLSRSARPDDGPAS